MTLHKDWFLPAVLAGLLCNVVLNPSWIACVCFLGAMASFVTCAIMLKDTKEPKEVTELKNKIEATSQDVKRLHLKLGFK